MKKVKECLKITGGWVERIEEGGRRARGREREKNNEEGGEEPIG